MYQYRGRMQVLLKGSFVHCCLRSAELHCPFLWTVSVSAVALSSSASSSLEVKAVMAWKPLQYCLKKTVNLLEKDTLFNTLCIETESSLGQGSNSAFFHTMRVCPQKWWIACTWVTDQGLVLFTPQCYVVEDLPWLLEVSPQSKLSMKHVGVLEFLIF